MSISDGQRNDALGMRALMGAILDDAVRIARDEHSPREEQRRAVEWIFSDPNGYVFGFSTVCDVLGIDPTALHRQLLRERSFPPWMLPPDLTESDGPRNTDTDPR